MRLYSRRLQTGFVWLGGSWALTVNEGGRGFTLFLWPAMALMRVYIAGYVFCYGACVGGRR